MPNLLLSAVQGQSDKSTMAKKGRAVCMISTGLPPLGLEELPAGSADDAGVDSQEVITFGTNALYGRSVDFVNTWGSAAIWVS